MRLLRKGGRPFLLFPAHPQAAAAGLGLYPAQKTAARLARSLLGTLFRAGVYPRTERARLLLEEGSPLASFMRRNSGAAAGQWPVFCSLAGNPNAAGQRFIFLLLDSSYKPRTVIKAGVGERALELLKEEADFLTGHGGKHPGIPGLLESLAGPELRAFALPYYEPLPGRGLEPGQIAGLLTSWLGNAEPQPVLELPQWRRLEEAFGYHPALANLRTKLAGTRVKPALYHGDFAAWNVRGSEAGPVVLDWERGEPSGPPGWDWFHYAVQDGVLVHRQPALRVLRDFQGLWQTQEFKEYARLAGIAGREPCLLLGYLLYIQRIVQPAEGKEGLRALQAEVEKLIFGASVNR